MDKSNNERQKRWYRNPNNKKKRRDWEKSPWICAYVDEKGEVRLVTKGEQARCASSPKAWLKLDFRTKSEAKAREYFDGKNFDWEGIL